MSRAEKVAIVSGSGQSLGISFIRELARKTKSVSNLEASAK